MLQVRLKTTPSILCPYCRDELGPERVACEGCGTGYHQACASEHPTCVLMGCEALLVLSSTQLQLESGDDWRTRAVTCVCCESRVAPRDLLPCRSCHAVHHRACLEEARGCTQEGCADPHIGAPSSLLAAGNPASGRDLALLVAAAMPLATFFFSRAEGFGGSVGLRLGLELLLGLFGVFCLLCYAGSREGS